MKLTGAIKGGDLDKLSEGIQKSFMGKLILYSKVLQIAHGQTMYGL